MHGIIEDTTTSLDTYRGEDFRPSTRQIPVRKRQPRRPKAVRLCDVAREAGVSIATVSLVLSDNPRISLATQRKVRAIAQRLGYRPIRPTLLRTPRQEVETRSTVSAHGDVYLIHLPAQPLGPWLCSA